MTQYIAKRNKREALERKIKKHNDFVKQMMEIEAQKKLTKRQKIDERRRKAQAQTPQGIPLTPIPEPNVIKRDAVRPSPNIELHQATIGEPRIHYLFKAAPLSEEQIKEYSNSFNKKSHVDVNGMSLWDFTKFIENKKIALVANSSELLDHLNGAAIDANDIVIRFNSYTLIPEFTGQKTTIHSYIHLQDVNIDIYVPLRLILAPNITKWEKAVKLLNKSKQGGVIKYFSEFDFLRSFMSKSPLTSGMRTLLMLVSIGGYERITLYGFDFYSNDEKSVLRNEEGTAYSISKVHDYQMEKKLISELCTNYDNENNLYIFDGNRSL